MTREEVRTVEQVCDFLDRINMSDLRFSIRQARAIHEWAVKSLDLGYDVGDRVEFTGSLAAELKHDPGSGWYHYREAFHKGAVAEVVKIDFNATYSYWSATIRLDREWGISSSGRGTVRYWHGPVAGTPEGYEPPTPHDQEHYPKGRRHVFAMPVRHLRPRSAS